MEIDDLGRAKYTVVKLLVHLIFRVLNSLWVLHSEEIGSLQQYLALPANSYQLAKQMKSLPWALSNHYLCLSKPSEWELLCPLTKCFRMHPILECLVSFFSSILFCTIFPPYYSFSLITSSLPHWLLSVHCLPTWILSILLHSLISMTLAVWRTLRRFCSCLHLRLPWKHIFLYFLWSIVFRSHWLNTFIFSLSYPFQHIHTHTHIHIEVLSHVSRVQLFATLE